MFHLNNKNNKNNSFFNKIVVFLLIFSFLIFEYSSFLKKIPFSFYDEILWISHSVFFQYYIHGNFSDQIWTTRESYDQPKLTEYIFGAWLYPKYLKEEKESINKNIDYEEFLIKNGFSEFKSISKHQLVDSTKSIKYTPADSGDKNYFLSKYGTDSLKTLELILHVRNLNMLFLIIAVFFTFLIAKNYINYYLALAFSIIYGTNSLIVNSSLKAHSEALFLLNFNVAVFFMIQYFKKRKFYSLLFFSLFSGLCFSTKLNGLSLLILFIILNTIFLIFCKKNRLKIIFYSLISSCMVLLVFFIFNPFVHKNFVKNILYMFNWRVYLANYVQMPGNIEIHLPNFESRILRIFNNYYFSKNRIYFNKPINVQIFHTNFYHFLFFLLGLIYSIKKSINKNIDFIILLNIFLLLLFLTGLYLFLDWDRYYINLSFFFIFLQFLGIVEFFKFIFSFLRNNLSKLFLNKKIQNN